MENNLLKGLIVAMVTPFNDDSSINKLATKRLVNHLINSGVDGLFVLGTNGESFHINEEDKLEFVECVVEASSHRVKVIAGAGLCSTNETITLANKFKSLGVDAVSVINPYFVKLSEKELINHYKEISDHVDLPIYLYNMPKNTGMNIDADVLEKIMEFKNIKGIKDSSGDIENTKKYIEIAKGKDFSVLTGSDSKIFESLKLGANGFIASTANLITLHLKSLLNSFEEGDYVKAESLQRDIDVLRNAFKMATQPAVTKRALNLLGFEVGECKLPILAVDESMNDKINEVIEFYNLKKGEI